MEVVLFLLRVLVALLLLGFLGVILFLLLRESDQSAINPTHTLPTPQPAKLIALPPEQAGLRTFELTRNAWLGRDPNSFIYIEDARVSARHAQLVWDGGVGAWFIEDNASRNSTWVNGVHVARQQLVAGDVIEVGGVRFSFVCGTPDP